MSSRNFEWPVPITGRLNIANRNIGCSSTVNLMLTFPTPTQLDISRLRERVTKIQELWPLLSITIADQRTTKPMMRYDYTTWEPDRIITTETYSPTPDNLNADKNFCYETACRLFQQKTAFDRDPLWRVSIFRADSEQEKHRVYLALLFDHIFIDGRGAINLAKALVEDDISHLPKESIELYVKAGLNQYCEEPPPYSFLIPVMAQGLLYSRLPNFAQKWLGNHPTWPIQISKPTIDAPWGSSILDIPADVVQKLRGAVKRQGASMNSTFHSAWIVAVWVVFLSSERTQTQQIKTFSVKDIRDTSKGDPYCVGGHATACMWASGLIQQDTPFWQIVESYTKVSANPQSFVDGANIMRMLGLSKDGPADPEKSKLRSPDSQALPVGDKRPHTLREESALQLINSLSPYNGLSGIWSNLSIVELPKGTIDMVIGSSGSSTGPAFNTVLLGHVNGVSVQNAYSKGAPMTEEEIKKTQGLFLEILRAIGTDGTRNWVVQDFKAIAQPVKAKL